MLRLRFSSGVVLGLALGLPLGALIALLAAPARKTGEGGMTTLQIQELTQKLDAAHETQLKPLRDRLEDMTRRLAESDETRAQARDQNTRIEEGLKALQARTEGMEQRLNRPQPQAAAQPPAGWQKFEQRANEPAADVQ